MAVIPLNFCAKNQRIPEPFSTMLHVMGQYSDHPH